MFDPRQRPKDIVILGGGAAGWLSACMISVYLKKRGHSERCRLTLIESPKVSVVGVGEGSWPTMRHILKTIGIDEEVFMWRCRASLKQGSRFIGWQGDKQAYDHPFELYSGFKLLDLLALEPSTGDRFARLGSCQPRVVDRQLSPKMSNDEPYHGTLNYGYHFDSAALIELLREHATTELEVRRLEEHIEGVTTDERGNITSLKTQSGHELTGDFFVDCSGAKGLLIKQHFQADWSSLKHLLFNNAALATRAPYVKIEQPILSSTYATAWEMGWIWDINLAHRRGVGIVYRDDLCREEDVKRRLEDYLFQDCGLSLSGARSAPIQKLSFEPGYLERFWVKNCVAIGMSAGFVEPLEASALVLVERSALQIAKALSIQELDLAQSAEDFNEDMSKLWRELVLFLKLHYVLSERKGPYWVTHRHHSTWPAEMRELITTKRGELSIDLSRIRGSLFSPFSYLCVVHGMGAKLKLPSSISTEGAMEERLQQKVKDEERLCRELLSNRALLKRYKEQYRKRGSKN